MQEWLDAVKTDDGCEIPATDAEFLDVFSKGAEKHYHHTETQITQSRSNMGLNSHSDGSTTSQKRN